MHTIKRFSLYCASKLDEIDGVLSENRTYSDLLIVIAENNAIIFVQLIFMKKTTFKITKMDCPSEEELIKMKLKSFQNIQELEFDLRNRELKVYYFGEIEFINRAIEELNFNSTIIGTEIVVHIVKQNDKNEKKLLWTVLIVNFSLFILELITGFIANSIGLVADSLDMFADAIVYGLSIYAIAKISTTKVKVAKVSGYFQMVLAVLGLIEVVRRFLGYDQVPEFQTMIYISILALIGNSLSLFLLQKSKSQEAHIKASMIFTSNDVIVNMGVIIAGIAVYFTQSKYPDLIIGGIVFAIVVKGAIRILKLT